MMNDDGPLPRRTTDRSRPAFPARVVAFAALLCGLVAGCSSLGDDMSMAFVDPGAYRLSTCQELVTARQVNSARRAELAQLIEKAEQGAGGAVVSAAAYRPEYLAATGKLRLIDEAFQRKDCVNSPFVARTGAQPQSGPSAPPPGR